MCHLLRIAVIVRIHKVYLRIYPFFRITLVLVFGTGFKGGQHILQVAVKVLAMVVGKAVLNRQSCIGSRAGRKAIFLTVILQIIAVR